MLHKQINAIPGMVATTAVQYIPASVSSWPKALQQLYAASQMHLRRVQQSHWIQSIVSMQVMVNVLMFCEANPNDQGPLALEDQIGKSSLEKSLVERVRLRAPQINGCPSAGHARNRCAQARGLRKSQLVAGAS